MTVAELIEKLQEFDQLARIVVAGYESDVDTVRGVRTIRIEPDFWGTDEFWAGEHRVYWFDEEKETDKVLETAILICGRHGDLPK